MSLGIIKDSIYVSSRVELKMNQKSLLIISKEKKYSYPLINKFSFDRLKKRLYYKKGKTKKSNQGLSKVLLCKGFLGSQLGYRSKVEVVGIGYSFSLKDNCLVMKLGYSHQVKLEIPKGIEVKILSVRKILLEGVSDQKVSNFGSIIQSFKLPNAYKRKGIYLPSKEGKLNPLKIGKKS